VRFPEKPPKLPEKLRHFAALIGPTGAVSAACFKKPHAINLKRESWSNRPGAVTCAGCRMTELFAKANTEVRM
jgi:hypothetical protein